MIKNAIVKLVNKGDLTYDEAYSVMNEIINGEKGGDDYTHTMSLSGWTYGFTPAAGTFATIGSLLMPCVTL